MSIKESDIEMKSSQEWYEEIPKEYGFIILDPDGWDRRNYNFSFNEELITKTHFLMRIKYSTCIHRHGLDLFETEWAQIDKDDRQ